jgi:hypothetical protein
MRKCPSIDESFELTKFEKPSDTQEIIIREAIPIASPKTPRTEVI